MTSPAPPDTRPADDLWRIVAAVAVVAIHAAGGFEAGWPAEPRTWAAVPVSQWARFSVPLFMVFSGFGLAHSELRRGVERFDGAAWRAFWRRRGPRIALPYLCFTAAGLWWNARLGPTALADGLLRGTGDYHLYFLAFLLQGYLIWPLVRCAPWSMVIALLALQALFASPMHLLWPDRPHVPAWIILHWAGYLALGARLARTAPRPPAGALPAAAIALALVLGEYTFWATRLDAPGHYNHFSRWVVIAYALAIVWLWRRSAVAWTRWLDAPDGSANPVSTTGNVDACVAPPRRASSTPSSSRLGLDVPGAPPPYRHSRPGHLGQRATRVSHLAGLTFTVYLIHPWALRALGRLPGEWPFLPRWLVATAASFALAAALDRWVRSAVIRRPLGLG